MKFVGAVIAHLVIASLLACGILLAVKGSLWLLAFGILAYLTVLTKVGFLPSGKSH